MHQRRKARQQQQAQVDQYNFMREQEARERERDLFRHPIQPQTKLLLRNNDLLKFYEEATSLKGNNTLLSPLIEHWDHQRQDFQLRPDDWHQPTEDDIQLIIGFSRRGEYLPEFLEVLSGSVVGNQLVSVQIC